MSVPKSKRTLSDLEFFHTALKIRRDIMLILLRDFGVRDKIKSVEFVLKSYNVDKQDSEILNQICHKYGMNSDIILHQFPSWCIEKFRNSVYDMIDNLVKEITIANSIYPTCLEECTQRRLHQDEAIGICYSLLNEFEFISSILYPDRNKYLTYVALVEKEIDLLKGWRKYTNKLRSKFESSDK